MKKKMLKLIRDPVLTQIVTELVIQKREQKTSDVEIEQDILSEITRYANINYNDLNLDELDDFEDLAKKFLMIINTEIEARKWVIRNFLASSLKTLEEALNMGE